MLTSFLMLAMRDRKLCFLLLCLLPAECSALDRNAFTFTDYDLQVQIDAPQHGLAAEGTVTLRNDSAAPQKNLALQISSSLNWISIKLAPEGKPLLYVVHPLRSDADHTGELSEALVTLPAAVAPAHSVQLELTYSGQIELATARLERIGTPKDVAANNDWDQIGPAFTAIRGLGYVAWYPVAMESVSLDDGHDYALTLAQWRQRHAATRFGIELGDVTPSAEGDVGFFNGQQVALLKPAGEPPAGSAPSNLKQFVPIAIGDAVPTLVLAPYSFAKVPGDAAEVIYYPAQQQAELAASSRAAEAAQRFIEQYFGKSADLQIVALPAGSAAFETGSLLLTPLPPSDLALTHALASNLTGSARPWISQGIAGFAQALLREQQDDRDAALSYMHQQLETLVDEEDENAQAEGAAAAKPLSSAATSLAAGNDDLLNRSKGMYVWWMLRDLLGDSVVKAALAAYAPEQDKSPAYMRQLLTAAAAQRHVSPKLDLEQFFDDWVYRDRGLPDFTVKSTYCRKLLASTSGENYMSTITLQNLGNAGAEVPVTVAAGERERATRRVVVPARSEASVRIPTVNLPAQVTINDGSVPESVLINNSAAVAAPSQE